MLKLFPHKDSHRVPWKYDVSLISSRIGKEEVYSNISLGLSGLTRSGRCYNPDELKKKKRKEIGKGTIEPVKNRVTIEEAEEFLKIIKNSEYSVIQQLNKYAFLSHSGKVPDFHGKNPVTCHLTYTVEIRHRFALGNIDCDNHIGRGEQVYIYDRQTRINPL